MITKTLGFMPDVHPGPYNNQLRDALVGLDTLQTSGGLLVDTMGLCGIPGKLNEFFLKEDDADVILNPGESDELVTTTEKPIADTSLASIFRGGESSIGFANPEALFPKQVANEAAMLKFFDGHNAWLKDDFLIWQRKTLSEIKINIANKVQRE